MSGAGLVHEPGAVLRDLVVMLADGGDDFSAIETLRGQAGLDGPVAPYSTAWRRVADLADHELSVVRLDAHVAGRITRSSRRVTLHLHAAWLWAADLTEAFPKTPRAAPARVTAAHCGQGPLPRPRVPPPCHHTTDRATSANTIPTQALTAPRYTIRRRGPRRRQTLIAANR